MADEEVISEPTENLPQYDAYNPSQRGRDNSSPKNPSGTEATIIVLVLGVLPDVIDFFSIGALSFVSSILSWPLTELYFYHKNLKIPNIRNWIRWSNLGDVIPFLGVLPLKTLGLVMAIYIVWHPESKFAKGAQALDVVSGAKKAPKKAPAGFMDRARQMVEERTERGKQETAGEEEYFEQGYEKENEEDVYERLDVEGIRGPEEEAEAQTFGEIISIPPEETEVESPRATTAPKPFSEIVPKEESEIKKGVEEGASVGGAYEEERKIKGTMGDLKGVLEENSTLNSNPQEVQSSDDEKVVNLKR